MAREILFKAKRIDNGEWVRGYYVKTLEGDYIVIPNREESIWGEGKIIEIDVNTLCQYTGLTDTNGNKIWENDVVHKADTSALGWCRERICTVSWDKWGYWKITTTFGDGYWIGEFDNEQLEVIGNIFDNPELLVATTGGAE